MMKIILGLDAGVAIGTAAEATPTNPKQAKKRGSNVFM